MHDDVDGDDDLMLTTPTSDNMTNDNNQMLIMKRMFILWALGINVLHLMTITIPMTRMKTDVYTLGPAYTFVALMTMTTTTN